MSKLLITYRYAGNKELEIPSYYDWFIISNYKANTTNDIYKLYEVLRSMVAVRYNIDEEQLIKNEDIVIVFMKELQNG